MAEKTQERQAGLVLRGNPTTVARNARTLREMLLKTLSGQKAASGEALEPEEVVNDLMKIAKPGLNSLRRGEIKEIRPGLFDVFQKTLGAAQTDYFPEPSVNKNALGAREIALRRLDQNRAPWWNIDDMKQLADTWAHEHGHLAQTRGGPAKEWMKTANYKTSKPKKILDEETGKQITLGGFDAYESQPLEIQARSFGASGASALERMLQVLGGPLPQHAPYKEVVSLADVPIRQLPSPLLREVSKTFAKKYRNDMDRFPRLSQEAKALRKQVVSELVKQRAVRKGAPAMSVLGGDTSPSVGDVMQHLPLDFSPDPLRHRIAKSINPQATHFTMYKNTGGFSPSEYVVSDKYQAARDAAKLKEAQDLEKLVERIFAK